jgi:hypothetical protein
VANLGGRVQKGEGKRCQMVVVRIAAPGGKKQIEGLPVVLRNVAGIDLYRYDVNLLPDYSRLTPFLKKYIELMGWQDLNWLEDVHLGYEEGRPAVFDRNINGWVSVPEGIELADSQHDRDMLARELLIKFQMSQRLPLLQLKEVYKKF